ncbi:MAG: glycosyltransferase family 4 protein [Rhizobiaceae bacterium]|nr:glycosyltransferase family 4 protein [Rhizobiaceae bacterium]
MTHPNLKSLDVIAPNLNRRLSGVTSTIVRLVPLQTEKIGIASFGVGLPDQVPRVSLMQLLTMGWRKKPRVWHARRNVEMLLGIFLKYFFRHNYKLLFTSASQRKHSKYTKFLINRMDHIIATSNAGAAYLEHDADVVYHGIDTVGFSPTADKQVLKEKLGLPTERLIGCFGRIRHQKGTDAFIDTMIDLLPKNPGWKALILGRATEQHQGFLSEQKKKIADADLSGSIIFAGEVPVDEIADYYRVLDLFIAPQRWEGFGLTPLEAMACGVPVVATTVGAFPEIVVENETGHLIPPGDIPAMINTTSELLSSDPTIQQFSNNARQHMVDNFDLSVEADRLIEIYRQMLTGKKH